ncbi:hypothetical protein HJ572_03255 [Pseudomonas aeruginosa]|uniref:hypothetical protein n=1 Tax=Pseudomonas aeruginosa TaxID=287 RepID=UPI0015C9D789|nr:hypothetical protein [Pseudomonas aeruginosa]MDS9504247.1 hypothetical protein [Pseudomonas aeruginosa]MDS9510997.1 hypothetical protein [Pseudomonas aeruginosa]MDS9530266.1 hypothetical protein [Pseudomonas aeruginosa]MDS9661558.1 hypothetical protein [Pseudomonas aeruginosa]MDS9670445.1 hypothetical protein [Pseudomonas aeruginosa]
MSKKDEGLNRVTFDSDRAMPVLGVPGRLTHRTIKPGKPAELWFKQRWVSERRPISGYPAGCTIQAEIRFDDELGNGHNSFSITATVWNPRRRGDCEACGCLHDDIATVFPELVPLIKWHLSATDGPIHYVANTCYHASDLDHNGRAKGEACAWDTVIRFGGSPVSHEISGKFAAFLASRMVEAFEGTFYRDENAGEFRVIELAHERDPKTYGTQYTLAGYGEKWHECPFRNRREADEWAKALNSLRCEIEVIPTAFSEGKARDLAAARSCAVWPEATDEQLSAPRAELKAALLERLPALLAEMRGDIEAAGFYWTPADYRDPDSL